MNLVLSALDSFNSARGHDIYLDALEHYVFVSEKLDRQEIIYLLRLFRDSANREYATTKVLLDSALREHVGRFQ